jgi:hypothetical protein
MPREVAVALKGLMQDVVQGGTARRVAGALTDEDGKPIAIGGKTGSGDNRFEKVTASGAVISSRAVNRTASFVFVVGDRYFGMMSAYVDGEDAGKYSFTSSLALQAFRMLAPAVEPLVQHGEAEARAMAPLMVPETEAPAIASRAQPSVAAPERQVAMLVSGAEAQASMAPTTEPTPASADAMARTTEPTGAVLAHVPTSPSDLEAQALATRTPSTSETHRDLTARP